MACASRGLRPREEACLICLKFWLSPARPGFQTVYPLAERISLPPFFEEPIVELFARLLFALLLLKVLDNLCSPKRFSDASLL